MLFGGDYVYAPGKSSEKDDFEYVPESRYNHTVTGYSSAAADYDDDGEVSSFKVITSVLSSFSSIILTQFLLLLLYRHVCWIF